MIPVAKIWNEKQKKLKVLLSDQKSFNSGKNLLLEMHSLLHDKNVYKVKTNTIYDNLWENLKDETCKIISNKDTSILWNIWHITRIEDMVTNILIGNNEEIFNKNIQKDLGIKIKDTGNIMTREEVELFSKKINIKILLDYRNKVGKMTRKIINGLNFSQMKVKPKKECLEKIYKNGGVLGGSKWLLDFWGKKNISGLIMMPITRHQIVHLNDCFRIKEKYKKVRKTFY